MWRVSYDSKEKNSNNSDAFDCSDGNNFIAISVGGCDANICQNARWPDHNIRSGSC